MPCGEHVYPVVLHGIDAEHVWTHVPCADCDEHVYPSLQGTVGEHCGWVGSGLPKQPWIGPVVGSSIPSHTPVSVVPASSDGATHTPGTLITLWSPWLEQKRLVICGTLLSGPAHALKLGVWTILPVEGETGGQVAGEAGTH